MKISKPFMLLAVSDVERSKEFYTEVMGQKVWEEYEVPGFHVPFDSGFGLQFGYKDLVEGTEDFSPKPTGTTITMTSKSNNYQIAFEVDKLDELVAKVKDLGLEFIHEITRYSWGQRVVRFYDYDGHIIELGEVEALWKVD